MTGIKSFGRQFVPQLNNAVEYHSDYKRADQNVNLCANAQHAAECEADNEAKRLPQTIIRKCSFLVVVEQHTVQCCKEGTGNKNYDSMLYVKVPMKRNLLLSHWKDLSKWFSKLFYSFSFTCFLVELFHFVYDAHATYLRQIHAH